MYPEKCENEPVREKTIREILEENSRFIEEIKNISMENLDNLLGSGANICGEEKCTNNILQILTWQNNDLKIILEVVAETNKRIGK